MRPAKISTTAVAEAPLTPSCATQGVPETIGGLSAVAGEVTQVLTVVEI
jgi:hypothetical protein